MYNYSKMLNKKQDVKMFICFNTENIDWDHSCYDYQYQCPRCDLLYCPLCVKDHDC